MAVEVCDDKSESEPAGIADRAHGLYCPSTDFVVLPYDDRGLALDELQAACWAYVETVGPSSRDVEPAGTTSMVIDLTRPLAALASKPA